MPNFGTGQLAEAHAAFKVADEATKLSLEEDKARTAQEMGDINLGDVQIAQGDSAPAPGVAQQQANEEATQLC